MSLWRLAANLAAGAALMAPLVIGAAALSGIGHRWIDLLAQFSAPALIAALLGTLACLALRLWPAAGLGAASCLGLLIAVWPQWTPPKGEPLPDQPVLRVYSANLYAFNTDVAAMRRSIDAADADIVILVEFGAAPLADVDAVLGGYPHHTLRQRTYSPGGPARAVIASRYPLTRFRTPPDGLAAEGAEVETPLGPLNVFAVHLTRPWPYQYQWAQITQITSLAQRRANAPANPAIVAGDFNSVSSARIGRQVQSEMGLIPAPGWPGTWPTQLPAFLGITIDQVYRSPDLALLSRRLGEPNGSDHRPVVTEFTRARP